MENDKITAKEIADDVQQTFDNVDNSYRQLLEDRINKLLNEDYRRRLFNFVNYLKCNKKKTALRMTHNSELIDEYLKSINEYENRDKDLPISDIVLLRAYTIGWDDALAGDDVNSVDEQSDEEILKHIKSII